MVRTADMAIKTGGKNSKSSGSSRSRSPSSSGSADRAYSSYNTVCPRETPVWQKPITSFFQNFDKSKNKVSEDLPKNGHVEVDASEVPDIAMEEEVIANDEIVNSEQSTTNHVEDDSEMQESYISIVAKIRRRDDEDHDIAPKKKRKLDANICAGLEVLEK